MKITVDLTPDECKDLLTPGPNQIKLYNDLVAAFTKSWMETMGIMQKNAKLWKKD